MKSIYHLKISLERSKPVIWRRFAVPSTINLRELHNVIQIVMGWTDSHLHIFTIKKESYGDPDLDDFNEMNLLDETEFRLDDLISRPGEKFGYEYDLGDSWNHTLIVEKILPAERGVFYPVCTDGKNACPPEDVGGMGGYYSFLESLADPKDEEHDSYLVWVGGKFDPDELNISDINNYLVNPSRNPWFEPVLLPSAEKKSNRFKMILSWAKQMDQNDIAWVKNNEALHDMLVFLNYLKNNRVVGSAVSGNLPFKHVREICSQFTNPQVLIRIFDDFQYPARKEDDIRSMVMIHQLAHSGCLIAGGPGERWRIIEEGNQFLQLDETIQAGVLCAIWWGNINWAILLYHTSFDYADVIDEFKHITYKTLSALQPEIKISFDELQDELQKNSLSVLRYGKLDQDKSNFKFAIKLMVINPLVSFGIMKCDYDELPGGLNCYFPSSVWLTKSGKKLLPFWNNGFYSATSS